MHYRDLASFNISYFELINFDYNFILERSETSDSRPYTTASIISKSSFNKNIPNVLQHDTGQNILPSDHGGTTEVFKYQDPRQFNIIPDPQKDTTTLQNAPEPSKTTTIQTVSELFDITMNNPQSLTITNDSKILQFFIIYYKFKSIQIQISIKLKMTLLKIQTKKMLLPFKYPCNSRIPNTTSLTSKS